MIFKNSRLLFWDIFNHIQENLALKTKKTQFLGSINSNILFDKYILPRFKMF